MRGKIALLKGDGIGPEIIDGAVLVLQRIGEKFGHKFSFGAYPIGGAAYEQFKTPLPPATIDGCRDSDAVLLGAVGGPQWDNLPGDLRPEKGLLEIRAALKLYANLRPAKLFPALAAACPLRPEIVPHGFDLVIVRELTGGIYFGERGRSDDRKTAFDTEKYSESEILRIGRVGFETAMKRRKKLVSVDKANVLESSRLWRETIHQLAKNYPEVEVSDLLVDNAAMQLVRNPAQFDVIVTSNMFGDILSDEIAQITGSIGMLASAALGDDTRGLYEPIHGSAPDLAGKGVANPIATILSAAMLLRYSFNLLAEAAAIEHAVETVLNSGKRTTDICRGASAAPISTSAMTAAIIAAV